MPEAALEPTASKSREALMLELASAIDELRSANKEADRQLRALQAHNAGVGRRNGWFARVLSGR